MEIWKPVVGYEGLYEVSNLGRIKSPEGKTTHSVLHGTRHWKERILKQKTDKKGYKRVELWKDKKHETWLVHRIVAKAFIPVVEGKDCINHIDGNPSNNNVNNLEWCNHLDNLKHAFENRLNQSPDPVVLLNKETLKTEYFYSKSEASKAFGRSHGYISGLLKQGKTSFGDYEIYVRPSKKEVNN